jgi:RND family efflux transporter MFP subunit
MNKKKVIGITILIIAIIVVILFYNKSRNMAKSQSDILSATSVSVAKVERMRLSATQALVGTIVANNDVSIISETQGKVTAVFAEIGQHLSAGSPIVQVDDELKKANFVTAETNYDKAKKDLKRFEALYKQNSVTDQQIEAARLSAKSAEAQYIVARRQYNDTKISTPIAGIVTSRPVDVGAYVAPGMLVANVVDISSLKVKLNVAESDVFGIKVGDNVEVSTDVYPGVVFKGHIKSISSKADDAHLYPVEVTFPNAQQHPLKAGMFGRVAFTSRTAGEVLTIPREALVGSMKEPRVYIVEGTIARLRNIVAGDEVGTSITVLRGLHEGEVIVTNGQNNLKDSTVVAIAQ